MSSKTQELSIQEVVNLIHEIKLGKLEGSFIITNGTLSLFKKMIRKSDWKSADELMRMVRAQGRILASALPQEAATTNMARRILKLIRDEFDTLQAKESQHEDVQTSLSLHKLVTQTSELDSNRDYAVPQEGLRKALLDDLQEIETELETSNENITAQAEETIHSSEVILNSRPDYGSWLRRWPTVWMRNEE